MNIGTYLVSYEAIGATLKNVTGGVRAPGFTLIELLIVVAIIAILAAIAIPNFLEAQMRAKVSRAKADLNSLATAMESYAIDNNAYAYGVLPGWDPREQHNWGFMNEDLTTPVSYMTSLQDDPFNVMYYAGDNDGNVMTGGVVPAPAGSVLARYRTMQKKVWPGPNSSATPESWVGWYNMTVGGIGASRDTPFIMCSPGPDRTQNVIPPMYPLTYDPSNGTVSSGDITYVAGGGFR
jgi:prepilin-type N-terminal cleavage/methylation domain-containing protein